MCWPRSGSCRSRPRGLLAAASHEELAALANALVAGCTIDARPFTPQEASDAVLATCQLGLECWPARWRDGGTVSDDVLVEHDLVTVFQVGWTVLHDDVCMATVSRLLDVLGGLPGARPRDAGRARRPAPGADPAVARRDAVAGARRARRPRHARSAGVDDAPRPDRGVPGRRRRRSSAGRPRARAGSTRPPSCSSRSARRSPPSTRSWIRCPRRWMSVLGAVLGACSEQLAETATSFPAEDARRHGQAGDEHDRRGCRRRRHGRASPRRARCRAGARPHT